MSYSRTVQAIVVDTHASLPHYPEYTEIPPWSVQSTWAGFLFDRESGRFTPSEPADCKPYYLNLQESSRFRAGRGSTVPSHRVTKQLVKSLGIDVECNLGVWLVVRHAPTITDCLAHGVGAGCLNGDVHPFGVED